MGTSVIFSLLLYSMLWALCMSAVRSSPSSMNFRTARRLFGNKAVDISSMKEHIGSLNYTPALKSIRSSDGDIIDCIPPSKQLAFHHPLLKDHKLQESPTTVPHRSASHDSGYTSTEVHKVSQVWHRDDTCPDGTIPVRRTTADIILKTGSSVQHYASKFYAHPQIFQGLDHEVSDRQTVKTQLRCAN